MVDGCLARFSGSCSRGYGSGTREREHHSSHEQQKGADKDPAGTIVLELFFPLVDRGSDGKYMTTKGSLGFFREGRQQHVATQ